jgi:adenylate kinase
MSSEEPRRRPIIVITGTPGTGKTTHAQALVDTSPVPLQHLNIGELVKLKGLHEGFDEEWQSYIVDDDKVCLDIFVSLGPSLADAMC